VEIITGKYQELAMWVGVIFMIPLSFCIAVSSEMSIKYLREVFAKSMQFLVRV
jgi:hypothetical protein